jgi:hypothetical protein
MDDSGYRLHFGLGKNLGRKLSVHFPVRNTNYNTKFADFIGL